MLGYESAVINGQLVNVAPGPAYNPLIFGSVYTGPSMWPRQGVYTVPPVLPSPDMQTTTNPYEYGGSPNAQMPTAQGPGGNPYHLTKSPVIWVIVFLALSLFMLHKVHY